MTFQQIERQRESFRRKWEREFRDTLEDQFTIYMDVWRSTGNKRAARQAVEEPEPMRESYRKFYRAVGTYFAIKQYADLQKLKDAPPRDYWTDKIDDYVRRTGKTKAQAINAYSAELLGAMTSEVSLEVLDDVEYEKLGNDWRDIVITRSERIFQTEVVCASELGKVEAAKYVRDEEGLPTMKRWQANLDAGVREAHYYADGKEAELDEYFTVGGEQLRFPGDTSGGATAKNLINCRCANEYFKGDGVPKPPDAEPEPTSTEDLQREQEKQPEPKPRPQETGNNYGNGVGDFKPAKSSNEARNRLRKYIREDVDATTVGDSIVDRDDIPLSVLNTILKSCDEQLGPRGIVVDDILISDAARDSNLTWSRAYATRTNSRMHLVFRDGGWDASETKLARKVQGQVEGKLDSLRQMIFSQGEDFMGVPRSEWDEVWDAYVESGRGKNIDVTGNTLNPLKEDLKEWLRDRLDVSSYTYEPRLFKDEESFLNMYANSVANYGKIRSTSRAVTGGRYAAQRGAKAIELFDYVVTHEVSHIVDYAAQIRINSLEMGSSSVLGRKLVKQMAEEIKKMDGFNPFWRETISDYASSDPAELYELWAEALTYTFKYGKDDAITRSVYAILKDQQIWN